MMDRMTLGRIAIRPNKIEIPIHNGNPTHQSEFRVPSKTLGAIVRGYKSAVTTQINTKKQSRPEDMAA